jgi:hypothetical protein
VEVMKGEIMESFFMKEECEEKKRKEIWFKERDQSKIRESLRITVLNLRLTQSQN